MKKPFSKPQRGPRGPKVSNILSDPIAFFCKDCELIVQGYAIGRKFVYKCAKCGTKNVAFGTEKALRDFYRVKEEAEVKKESEKKEEVKAKENSVQEEPKK